MVHTYEVLVDIKEFADTTNSTYQCGTSRYEISAESIQTADYIARSQARSEHPKGTEYDVRVTRLLS
ncbi:hypothetical protein Nos7524_2299 [Nostoc sp. PCC 7524]|jgi:hypothetical protein|uniref:hypothetical protein n=1 Tax=Nostoc sp. (strain ATCC 29411 / PCC 7524) TaxID=28072 RepID=UPI00029F46D4|nr:hypothetical protein [Nostoc sp. PCC 7524]AFY48142.1 hypothetical protein Nos7524_2299 [Nostoc sp. PCC 7524]